jgi:hypothetical protein
MLFKKKGIGSHKGPCMRRKKMEEDEAKFVADRERRLRERGEWATL